MIYSSLEFILLLLATLGVYSGVRSPKQRAWVLILSSVLFYSWAGLMDLLIFALVLCATWAFVMLATRYPKRRTFFTVAGITLLTIHLFTWKYFSWSAEQIQSLFPGFLDGKVIRLALPLGISFYSLQKIAYLVDVYKGVAKPIPLYEFLLFNGFFAQLIAGPITRAGTLVPQIRKLAPIRPANVWRGAALFASGFFKKMVIADNLRIFVDSVFQMPRGYSTAVLILGIAAFASQMWADFSGYTDMGRGAAQMFGIELPENFMSPFFARGPSEFWKRWHITLSTWIRDYLFIPLWLSAGTGLGAAGVLILTMFLTGLWHGAEWTFVLYGFYWGALMLLEHLWRRTMVFKAGFRALPSMMQASLSMALMYILMLGSRLLFRAGNLRGLRAYIDALINGPGRVVPSVPLGVILGLIALSFAIQFVTYRPLTAGSEPNWKIFRDFLGARVNVGFSTRSAAVMGSLGLLFGLLLGVVLIGSLLASSDLTPRSFIYFQF